MNLKKTERGINEPMKVILRKSDRTWEREYRISTGKGKIKKISDRGKKWRNAENAPEGAEGATLGLHEEPQRARGVWEADLKDTPNMRRNLFGFLDKRHVSIGRCGGCWSGHVSSLIVEIVEPQFARSTQSGNIYPSKFAREQLDSRPDSPSGRHVEDAWGFGSQSFLLSLLSPLVQLGHGNTTVILWTITHKYLF